MKRTLLGIIALLVSGAACAEPAGRVLLSVGEVSALRGGAAVALARGDTVESGDRIRTGPDSDAQIRFTDTSIVALRSNTDFGVERYHFSGKADGSENALFALLKGGMRTITGLIGRLRHDRYAVRTRTATIGIRGTDFGLVVCRDDCRDRGGMAANGTYGTVYEGRIGVTPNAKPGAETQWGPGQFFRITRDDTPAEPLLAPPPFLSDNLDGQRRFAAGGNPQDEAGAGIASGGLDARAREPATPATPAMPLGAYVATDERSADGGIAVLGGAGGGSGTAPSGPAAPTALYAIDDWQTFGAGFDNIESISSCVAPSCSIVISGNSLVSYATGGGSAFPSGSSPSSFATGGTSVADGSTPFQINWGSWGTTASVILASGSACSGTCYVNNLLYAVTNSPFLNVLPASGVVSYNYAGGPSGNYYSNAAITVNSMTANVDFGLRTLSFNASLGYVVPYVTTATFTLSTGTLAIPGSNTISNAALTVGCAGGGGACQVGATRGTLNVNFSGSAAQAAIANGAFPDPTSTYVSGTRPNIPFLGVMTR